jgi:hypothetical protein
LWLRAVILFVACQVTVNAHSGPPFPIVSDQIVGAYRVSIWTDPDATNDGAAAGKFWVMLQPASGQSRRVPAGTHVEVTIKPLDRANGELTGRAAPVNGDAGRQFVALLMDHEGRFSVRVNVTGPLADVRLETTADATYDLRPQPILTIVFILPFVLAGIVWGKLLIRRRIHRQGGT